MKTYYEIIEDTDAYKAVKKEREIDLLWVDDKIHKGIKELLGVDNINGNLRISNNPLIMEQPPEHIKTQFCKPKNGLYYAKKKSRINHLWVDFCKTNGLRRARIWGVLEFSHSLYGAGSKKSITFLGDRYFIISETEITIDYLRPTTEEEYLTARLAFLKNKQVEK